MITSHSHVKNRSQLMDGNKRLTVFCLAQIIVVRLLDLSDTILVKKKKKTDMISSNYSISLTAVFIPL